MRPHSTAPQEEQLEVVAETGVGQQVVQGVEVPRVELYVERPRTHNTQEVTQKEGKENVVCIRCFG